ncbi:MAG: hypothetical protein KDE51_08085, partial [Anaerolineales bacterium]|nr:hypothetical protein [Anaerolineales bacterium]
MKRQTFLFILIISCVLLCILALALFTLNQHTPVPASWGTAGGPRNTLSDWLGMIGQTAFFPIPATIVGVLIINRYRRHPIGWLLIAMGLLQPIDRLLAEWAIYGYYTNPGQPLALIAGWVVNWSWGVLMILIALLPILFPNGRFLSKGFKVAFFAVLIAYFGSLLIASTQESPMTSAFMIPNPFVAQTTPLYDTLFNVIVITMPLLFLLALGSVGLRFRRSAGRERQQMKWFMASLTMLVVQLFAGFYLGSVVSGLAIGDILINVMSLWLILGIGIALLRHNLYDIDLIIRRTFIYAVVSVLLATIYFGSVILMQSIITAAGGQQSPIISVLSTLLIAALFNPLRQRIQAFIDRRFYR